MKYYINLIVYILVFILNTNSLYAHSYNDKKQNSKYLNREYSLTSCYEDGSTKNKKMCKG